MVGSLTKTSCGVLLTAILVLGSPAALGGTIKSVNKSKGTIVVGSLEADDGVSADATVCIYNDSGKSVGCGVVTKVGKSSATVKLKSKKSVKRVTKGMTVRAKTSSSSSKTAGDDTGSAPASKGKRMPFRIWASYSPALATPAVYNKLAYKLPESSAPETIWEPSESSQSSFMAFNFQAGVPISSYSLNLGFRFRSYTDAQVDADYSATNGDSFARTQQTASALGFWADFQFMQIAFTKSMSLGLSSGLDMDMSSVKFKATSMDDTGELPEVEIASATSSLTVISLRLGAGIDYMFAKSFGAHAGTTVMVPLTEMGKKFSGSSEDANVVDLPDPGKDLETQLGHKKNSVAYEFSLGLVLAF